MAIGFTPKYIQDYPLSGLTLAQFLVIAVDAVNNIGWEITYLSESALIAYTNKGMFSRNAEIRIQLENDAVVLKSTTTGTEMIDWGKNKKNILNFISTFEELKPACTTEELVAKYDALKENKEWDETDILKQPPLTATPELKGFFSIFKPVQGYFITPLLININVLVFILMVIGGVNIMSPDTESLIKWGANFRVLTLDGQWWRLITNFFLHIGFFHLLMNMFALVYIGLLLEPRLGRIKFFAAYMLCGIAASTTSLYWHDTTVSAGASGAIFGLYGVFLAMLTGNAIEKNTKKSLLTSIAFFVVYNLMNGLKGGIDNSAHIGGLISGVIMGYAFIPSLKKPEAKNLEFSIIGLLTILILSFTAIVYTTTPNDLLTYETKMKTFDTNEKIALEVYHLPKDTPNDTILYSLKNRGIFYWNENIKLIDEVETLHLPDEMHKRNAILKQYCWLRLQCYELIYQDIQDNSDQFNDKIEDYNKKIESIVNQLNPEQKN